MKLTKLQRHTAYIIMLTYFEDFAPLFNIGLCRIAHNLFGLGTYSNYGKNSWEKNLKYFPEYRRKKPNGVKSGETWFNDNNGREKRIALLKQCIIETY